MSQCPSSDRISAHADGEDTDAALTEHVALCATCGAALAESRRVAALLGGARPPAGHTRDACPSADAIAQIALGELDDAAREPITMHLEACAACAEIAGFLDPDADAIEPDHAPALVARVQMQRRRRQTPRWIAPLAAAAAVLMLALPGAWWGLSQAPAGQWSPQYQVGDAEQVAVRLSMRGAIDTPAGRRPLDREIDEHYERRIVAVHDGEPSETLRAYSAGPAADSTLALRHTASDATEVTRPRTGAADWMLASDGRTVGVMEESLAFLAPGRPMQIGEQWTPQPQRLQRLLERFLSETLGDITDATATCRLTTLGTAHSEAAITVELRTMHRSVALERTSTGTLRGQLHIDHQTGRVTLLWLTSDAEHGLQVHGRTADGGTVHGRVDLHLQLGTR